MSLPQFSYESRNTDSEIVYLSQLSGYKTFGTMLALIRTRNGLNQQQIAEGIMPYFRSRRITLDRRMYGRLENDERFPLFEELEPLFRTFVETFGVVISDVERAMYIQLAQKRLEQKQKKRERITTEQWNQLAVTLAQIEQQKKPRIIQLVDMRGGLEKKITESPISRRLQALKDMLRTDTSHLLERHDWLQQMVQCVKMVPQKKLVVVKGGTGAGKSHALALLAQELSQESNIYLIPNHKPNTPNTTPDDQLLIFLSTILTDLQQIIPDETKDYSVKEKIEHVLFALKEQGKQGQKIVLLLDDAQGIFPSPLEWSDLWKQFFLAFVEEPHSITIFFATRIWSGWIARKHSYIEESDLPELSPEAGMEIWRRFGFTDVPESLLREVSIRGRGNPQYIELTASHLKRATFTFSRPGLGAGLVKTRSPQKNDHTVRLEALLAQDSLFGKSDIDARKMLQQVVTRNLSHQAVEMVECLAVAQLGIPFTLLEQEFPQAEVVYDELVRASLVDLGMAAANRAAVAPLVQEAQLQLPIADGRIKNVEARLTTIYSLWLTNLQDFRDDAEKSALIAEIVIRSIKQALLLDAAELFISYGWLCSLFGHVARIQRVFQEYLRDRRGSVVVGVEIGETLLTYHIGLRLGQKLSRAERDRLYQHIYKCVIEGSVTLEAHSEIDVLQHMLLFYMRQERFSEAEDMLAQTLLRLDKKGALQPDVSASFLYNKARLLSGLAEKEEQAQQEKEARVLYLQCVEILKECILNWRRSLKNAMPLQEHYAYFKLARALNDYAFYLRIVGRLDEARSAIEESLRLKKMSGALPHSIAISLSEYSQVLAAQGEIRHALAVNDEALQAIRQANQDQGSHAPELGMFLVERADILCLQARLIEAKPLLSRAVELIGDKPSRQRDRLNALAKLEHIHEIEGATRPFYLDRRWITRYTDLVEYDDLAWLVQAGPFTELEQQEWDSFSLPHTTEQMKRIQEIVAQSRKREFTRSLETNSLPLLSYPCIPIDEVERRMNGLLRLRKDIEQLEANVIVKRLYLEAIDEHTALLRLCEAIVRQDQETVWQCNLYLYGKPSQREARIALQALCLTLLEAEQHPLAGPVAQEILAQLEQWDISPHDLVSEDFFPLKQVRSSSLNPTVVANERKSFDSLNLQRFFEKVLAMYGAENWEVSISPARDHTYIDTNVRRLVLPQKSFTVGKIRQLLAEEIETHAYRSISGWHSPFALLGSGLAKHTPTEEGLAYAYVQRVSQQINGEETEKTWIGTLATSLASGILTPALSFQDLRAFLTKTFYVNKLLSSYISSDEAYAAAQQSAWVRSCRTFRGVPSLQEAGYSSLKDRIYLAGYLEVMRNLEQAEEQRLYVGSIAVSHLEAMAELNILKPSRPHQHLALLPDLYEQIMQSATEK